MQNNFMQMLQTIRNPQQFIQQAMQNSQLANNPIAKNAFEMYQKGDTSGLNELANNLCKERNIEPEKAIKDIKAMFGIN